MATRLGKKQKVITTYEGRNMRGQVTPLEAQVQQQQPIHQEEREDREKNTSNWKPRIENLNVSIFNEANPKKLVQYYDKYLVYEQRNLDVTVIQYMIKFKKALLSIHGELLEEIYEILNEVRLKEKKEEEKLERKSC